MKNLKNITNLIYEAAVVKRLKRTGDLDKIATFYMTRDQEKANKDIFADVDDGLLATLEEYEKKESLEARIVYEANIIAFLVE